MRIMLDTNVLLSALLFPGEWMNRMMRCIFEEHRLVLSSFVVEELGYVVRRSLCANTALFKNVLQKSGRCRHSILAFAILLQRKIFSQKDIAPAQFPVLKRGRVQEQPARYVNGIP